MSAYESEFALFLRKMRDKHPEWVDEQRAGRALLWDKKVDFEELRRFSEASVHLEACHYDLDRS